MAVGFDNTTTDLNDDRVDQMLVLAERLREKNGGVLDDSAVQAVAEATGAPVEYVRLAVKLRTEKEKHNFIDNLRTQYLMLEPETRRYVLSGLASTLTGLMQAAESKSTDLARHAQEVNHQADMQTYGVFGMIGLVMLTLGLYNVAVSRDARTATISGAIFGGGYLVTNAIFCYLFNVHIQISSSLLIPFTIAGAVCGLVLQRVVGKHRDKLGLRDPARERQDLLRQLQDLQDRLKSGEQSMTILSVDIVGSTKMKQLANPLDVEFTFTEYHHFVDMLTRKHGGRVHSTAGDGVTCAFPTPQQAFAAARNIQTGLFELNTYRNKIGKPIVVRQALHTGNVVTPDAEDIKSIQISHVIDIAAHLQKVTAPGTVAVSDVAAAYLPGGPATVGTAKVEASGVIATVWSPRPVAYEAAAIPAPPVPNAASEMA